MVPTTTPGGVGTVGIAVQNADLGNQVPNPFNNNTNLNQIDPKIEDIKKLVKYWDTSQDDQKLNEFETQALKTVSTLLKNMLEQPFEEKYRKISLSNSKILNMFKSNIKLLRMFKEFQFFLFQFKSPNKSQKKIGIENYVNKAFNNDNDYLD